MLRVKWHPRLVNLRGHQKQKPVDPIDVFKPYFVPPINNQTPPEDTVWGDITGSITSQSDLIALINNLQNQINALSSELAAIGGASSENDFGSGDNLTIDFTTNPGAKCFLNRANTNINVVNVVPTRGYLLRVVQDIVGLRQVTWDPSIIWPGTTPPSPSNRNQVDLYGFYTDGTYKYGSYLQTFPNPSAFDPSVNIANNVFWFDGNDTTSLNGGAPIADTNLVTTWADKSGQGNDATQASSSLKPIFRTNQAAGLGVIRFSQKTMVMPTGFIFATENSPFTVIFKVRFNSFSGLNDCIMSFDATTVHKFFISVSPTGNIGTFGSPSEWISLSWNTASLLDTTHFHTIIVTYNGAGVGHAENYAVSVDGVSATSSSAGTGSDNPGTFIGSAGGIFDSDYMAQADFAQIFGYAGLVQGTDLTNFNAWMNAIIPPGS